MGDDILGFCKWLYCNAIQQCARSFLTRWRIEYCRRSPACYHTYNLVVFRNFLESYWEFERSAFLKYSISVLYFLSLSGLCETLRPFILSCYVFTKKKTTAWKIKSNLWLSYILLIKYLFFFNISSWM